MEKREYLENTKKIVELVSEVLVEELRSGNEVVVEVEGSGKIKFENQQSLNDLKSALGSIVNSNKKLKECLTAIVANRQGDFAKANNLFENIDLDSVEDINLMTITLAFYINNHVNLDNVESGKTLYEKYHDRCVDTLYYPLLVRVYVTTLNNEDGIKILSEMCEKTNDKYERSLIEVELAKKLCIANEIDRSIDIFDEKYRYLVEHDKSNCFVASNNYAIALIYKGNYHKAIQLIQSFKWLAKTDLQKVALEMNMLVARVLWNKKNVMLSEVKELDKKLVENSSHSRAKQQFYINALFIEKYLTGEISEKYLKLTQKNPDRNGKAVTDEYIKNIRDMETANIESVLKAYKPIYLAHWTTNSIKYLFNISQ